MQPAFPLGLEQVEAITKEYPTPFHIYDQKRIIENGRRLKEAFQTAGFADSQNYFAVKALPNPTVMKLLTDTGQGLDCSSLAELELATKIGVKGENIMFSSNDTASEEYKRAQELGAIINFDDVTHVPTFLRDFGAPKIACCRYNPGDISFKGANEAIIGKPSEAKYGMTKPQLIETYTRLKEAGVAKFGLHTMLLSNELDWHEHARIADMMFGLAVEISHTLGIEFSFINLGGGIGVPYKPSQKPFDITAFASHVRTAYDAHNLKSIGQPRIVMENGRYITADAGYLITKVIHLKNTYKRYIGTDASMANLMRPGMYGAYHHVTVLGKGDTGLHEIVDVTGSLCENNDKFAIDRKLPHIEEGDYLVIHTTGAHGHAMGFQYNGKLRSAELLLKPDGSVKLIRRAETLDDYFATLKLNGKEL